MAYKHKGSTSTDNKQKNKIKIRTRPERKELITVIEYNNNNNNNNKLLLRLFEILNLLHQGGKICSKYLTVQRKRDMTNYWVQCRLTPRSCGTQTAYLCRHSTSADIGLLYYSNITTLQLLFSPVRFVSR